MIKKNLTINSQLTFVLYIFLAPALVLMAVGVLEFGTYFLRSQSAHNAVAATMTAVLADPTDSNNRNLLRASFTDYNNSRNFGCARPFRTQEAANNGNYRSGVWNTNSPRNHEGDYFVLLRSHIAATSTTRLFDSLIPSTNIRQVIRVSQNAQGNCDESELNGRACIITREGYDITRVIRDVQGNGGDRKTNNFNISTSRTIALEPPQCSSEGWSCEFYEGVNPSARGVGTITNSGSSIYQMQAQRTHSIRLGSLDSAPRACNESRFHNRLPRNPSPRSTPLCWTGSYLPSSTILNRSGRDLRVRAF